MFAKIASKFWRLELELALHSGLIMHAVPAIAAGIADAITGTLFFVHGSEWERIQLRSTDFLSPVNVADLWLVRVHIASLAHML